MENFKRDETVNNVISKFDKKPSDSKPTDITPVVEVGKFCTGANIFMSVRQAETILMLSGFLEQPANHGPDNFDRNSDAEIQRVNTMFELAMLIRTIAKGVAGEPSELSIRDMAIGYGHVPTDYRY